MEGSRLFRACASASGGRFRFLIVFASCIRVTIRPQFYKPKAVTREILSSRRSIDPLGPSVDTNAKLTLLDVFCRVEARKELFS